MDLDDMQLVKGRIEIEVEVVTGTNVPKETKEDLLKKSALAHGTVDVIDAEIVDERPATEIIKDQE